MNKQPKLKVRAEIQSWPMKQPFLISGFVFDASNVLYLEIENDVGIVGRAEAAGVYYFGETPDSVLSTLLNFQSVIEEGMARDQLQTLLPPGGARNAIDCALWDLEAKCAGTSVAALAGLSNPQPLLTTFTCGAAEPVEMAMTARSYEGAKAIKLKLTGEKVDGDRVAAVRDALPDVWLGVDPNQGFSRGFFDDILAKLQQENVSLIEQPFPVGCDHWLDGLASPIKLAADESVQDRKQLKDAVNRYNVINIKLDKSGGLTEALAMAAEAKSLGFDIMVGNMTGTSLAMAPAFLVGQGADIVDLDGPVFLSADRADTVEYRDGAIIVPSNVWG